MCVCVCVCVYMCACVCVCVCGCVCKIGGQCGGVEFLHTFSYSFDKQGRIELFDAYIALDNT